MNCTIDIKKAWQIERTGEGIFFVDIVENINYIREKNMRPTKQRTYLEHLKKNEVKIDLLLPCLNEVISQQLPSGKLFMNCHPR